MQIPGLGSLFGTQYALLVGFQFRPGTALQKFCPDFTLRGWRGQEFRVRALRGLFYNFVYLWWRQMPGWSTGSGTQEMKETVGWRVLINQIRRVGYMFIAPPPPPHPPIPLHRTCLSRPHPRSSSPPASEEALLGFCADGVSSWKTTACSSW